MATVRALCFVLLLGAPPDDGTGGETDDEVSAEAETSTNETGPEADADARTRQGEELYDKGDVKWVQADYVGAIEDWEQAYELLPPTTARDDLAKQLANTHKLAYEEGDADSGHLYRARVLFRDYLATLDASAQGTRETVEAQLAEVQDELDRLEAEEALRQEELAEAEAEAAAEAKAEEVTKQYQELDPWTDAERRRYRLLVGVGGGLTGVGVVLAGVTVANMALGALADSDGLTVAGNPDADPALIQSLRRDGVRYNNLAYGFGAVGGAMLVSGTAMIIVAVIERQRAKDQLERTMRLRPGVGGFEVRF